jgi:hypothetical protein
MIQSARRIYELIGHAWDVVSDALIPSWMRRLEQRFEVRADERRRRELAEIAMLMDRSGLYSQAAKVRAIGGAK